MRSNINRLFWLGAALVLAAFAAGQGKVTGVDASGAATNEIEILGSSLHKPWVASKPGSKTLHLVFQGGLDMQIGGKQVQTNGLRYVSFGWQSAKPPRTWVKLWFDGRTKAQLKQTANGWAVNWTPIAASAHANKPAAQAKTKAAKAKSPSKSKVAKAKPAPSKSKKAAAKIADPSKAEPAKAEAAKPKHVAKAKTKRSKSKRAAKAKSAPAKVASKTKPEPQFVGEGDPVKPEPEPMPSIDTQAIAKKPAPKEVVRTMRPADPNDSSSINRWKGSRVSLDFVNTDVVQILRALALQGNVNIVTAPQVAGKISVALQDVTVKEALDFVTSMADLRYAQIGVTYVVTPRGNISAAVQQIKGELDAPSETRVVTLQSGEGAQIKASVLKAMPQDTLIGHYQIVLPSEKIDISTTSSSVASQGLSAPTGGQSGSAAPGERTNVSITGQQQRDDSGLQEKKDPYLVLVGSPIRLNEVEPLVRDLDKKIVNAARLGVTAGISTRVVPVYSSQVERIRDTVRTLVERDPAKASFSINDNKASDVGADSVTTMLVMSGPTESMDTLEEMARSLDKAICDATGVYYPKSPQDAQRSYVVVELMYVEPIEAAFELQNRVRGLTASLMPAPADPLQSGGTFDRKKDSERWNPRVPKGSRIFVENGTITTAASTGSAPAAGGSSAPASGGGSSQTDAAAVAAQVKRESGVEPMKLLLRGTPGQIAQARELLSILDVEPKMVAVEVRVMNLSKEEAEQWGIDWSILANGFVQSFRMNQSIGGTANSAGNVSATLQNGSTTGDILATIDSLSNSQRLIARPNLLAINGKPASIFVGDKVLYVKTIQASQNGTTIEVGELNVGVEMTVVPRIGDNGMITLDLSPSLTVLRGFTPVPGGGNLPQTTERFAQSQVVLKSGETIALGGLIQDEDRKEFNGIPILKDLPLIGKLFSRTDKRKTRTEVVFFLRAREVTARDRANAANPRENEPPQNGNAKTGKKGN